MGERFNGASSVAARCGAGERGVGDGDCEEVEPTPDVLPAEDVVDADERPCRIWVPLGMIILCGLGELRWRGPSSDAPPLLLGVDAAAAAIAIGSCPQNFLSMATSSCLRSGFVHHWSQPASNAFERSSLSAFAVRAAMNAVKPNWRMAAVASYPFITGMEMSIAMKQYRLCSYSKRRASSSTSLPVGCGIG